MKVSFIDFNFVENSENRQFVNLQTSWTLCMVVDKVPEALTEKCLFYVIDSI